jgi:hypothetical protein
VTARVAARGAARVTATTTTATATGTSEGLRALSERLAGDQNRGAGVCGDGQLAGGRRNEQRVESVVRAWWSSAAWARQVA